MITGEKENESRQITEVPGHKNLKILEFILSQIGSHWRVQSGGVTWFDSYVNRMILSLWRTDNTEARIQSKVLARRQVKRLFQYPSMSLRDSRDGDDGGVLNIVYFTVFLKF